MPPPTSLTPSTGALVRASPGGAVVKCASDKSTPSGAERPTPPKTPTRPPPTVSKAVSRYAQVLSPNVD
jgi:hypothetical protein